NPDTGELKFNFNIDPWFGLGTPVDAVTGPKAVVTTVVNGTASANEVQELVVNATAGAFKLSSQGKSTDFIKFLSSTTPGALASSIESHLNDPSVLGPNAVHVAASDGIFRIVFDGPSVQHTDVPQLGVDLGVPAVDINLGLFNDKTKQPLIVPANAGTFWLAYPDAGGRMELTDKLSPDASAAEIKSALAALAGIGGADNLDVTRHDPEGNGPVTYTIQFKGDFGGSTPAKTPQ